MEALACDIPVLCAGFGYGVVVRADNVETLLTYNMTGWRLPADFSNLAADLRTALSLAQGANRRLAEKHMDACMMAARIVAAVRDLL